MMRDFICLDKQLSKNKSLEIQLSYFGLRAARSIFNFVCRWTLRTHHAGPLLSIDLFGFYLGICIYDHRHWDDDVDDYEKPGA